MRISDCESLTVGHVCELRWNHRAPSLSLSLSLSPCREAATSCFSWIPRGNSSRLIFTKAIVNSSRGGSEVNRSFVFTGRPCCILVIILMRCRNMRDCNARQRAFDARIKGAGISRESVVSTRTRWRKKKREDIRNPFLRIIRIRRIYRRFWRPCGSSSGWFIVLRFHDLFLNPWSRLHFMLPRASICFARVHLYNTLVNILDLRWELNAVPRGKREERRILSGILRSIKRRDS